MTTMLRGRNGGFDHLAYGGCSCHNSKAAHRKDKHSVKRREERTWKGEVVRDLA